LKLTGAASILEVTVVNVADGDTWTSPDGYKQKTPVSRGLLNLIGSCWIVD